MGRNKSITGTLHRKFPFSSFTQNSSSYYQNFAVCCVKYTRHFKCLGSISCPYAEHAMQIYPNNLSPVIRRKHQHKFLFHRTASHENKKEGFSITKMANNSSTKKQSSYKVIRKSISYHQSSHQQADLHHCNYPLK